MLSLAWAFVVAGFLVIIWGIYVGMPQNNAAKKVAGKIDGALGKAEEAVAAQAAGGGVGELARQQADVSSATDYVKALAELAAALEKLSPTVSAFLVSTIFFFLAGVLATIEDVAS